MNTLLKELETFYEVIDKSSEEVTVEESCGLGALGMG